MRISDQIAHYKSQLIFAVGLWVIATAACRFAVFDQARAETTAATERDHQMPERFLVASPGYASWEQTVWKKNI